ncbi:hypothetical protein DL96DRAFT_1711360 [Flagelloscypha sp. PMI_526]|nr:hypothetical protein DL96DRAFT_1711360 [Flagelloscypha sp. PMI_526]
MGIKTERFEIIKYTSLPIAFLGLVLRYCWLIWRRKSAIPRGVDLVFHVAEMALVLWPWATFQQVSLTEPAGILSNFYTVGILYIPSALFLLVVKMLDIVRSNGGIWLGLRAATRTVQQANKSRMDRMSLAQPRLIVARFYLIIIIGHTMGFFLAINLNGVEFDYFFVYPYINITILAALSVSSVHHLQSFFVVRFLPRGLDFSLLLLEHLLLNLGLVSYYGVIPWPALPVMFMPERLLISILLAFRIWDVMQCGARAREPLNLVPSYDVHSSRMALLLGRNAWENLSLRGEPTIVKSLRGILATAALFGLGIFSTVLISRNATSSQDEMILKTFVLKEPKKLYEMDPGTPAEPLSTPAFLNHPEIIQITQTCRSGLDVQTCLECSIDPYSFIPGPFQNHGCWACPTHVGEPSSPGCQVQVQVDFQRGVEIGAFPGGDYDQFLYVSLVLHGIDNTTVGKIPTVPLRRNRALEGDAVFYQYEFLRESRLASFGFGSSSTAIVGEIKFISNDPTYTIPSNFSYLKYRYSHHNDVMPFGVREYTDRTVLDALAAIGGIWTFGNGLFALVFGGSLLYFLLGLRPLSRFGFVHLFIRGRLRQATREQYPNFHREGGQPGEAEAGVVTFIRQHLLGVVEDEEEEQERKKRRREWERVQVQGGMSPSSRMTLSVQGGNYSLVPPDLEDLRDYSRNRATDYKGYSRSNQLKEKECTEIRAFVGPEYNQVLYIGIYFGWSPPEIDDITFGKIPKTTLRRNRALEGDAVFYRYEFIKKSGFTSLGFESSNQLIMGDVKSISNDPTYTIPNNLAYLKYRYSPLYTNVSIGVQEHADKTVLDAFASIGGIWTFGDGLFTIVFGGSLLYFLFGFRPLSRFGFVHLLIRDRLRQSTREQYPNFHREGGQPGEAEAGVVSFIRQHLLGVVEDDEEEEVRKKRRREWERQRDEMELLSFEVVSGSLHNNTRRTTSGRYQSLQQDDLERPG